MQWHLSCRFVQRILISSRSSEEQDLSYLHSVWTRKPPLPSYSLTSELMATSATLVLKNSSDTNRPLPPFLHAMCRHFGLKGAEVLLPIGS